MWKQGEQKGEKNLLNKEGGFSPLKRNGVAREGSPPPPVCGEDDAQELGQNKCLGGQKDSSTRNLEMLLIR